MRALFASAAIATACVWASPVQADIRDVAVAAAADRALIALALDAAPSAAASAPIADGFMIDLSGVELVEGVWEPYDARLVRRIEMRPRDGGAALAVFTQIEVLSARARIEGHSVVVDLRLAENIGAGAAAPPRVAAAPVAAPAADEDDAGDEAADEAEVAHADEADGHDEADEADAIDAAVLAENEHGPTAAEEGEHDGAHDASDAHGDAEAEDGDDHEAAGGSFGGPAVIGPTAEEAATSAAHAGAPDAADEDGGAPAEEAPVGGEAAHLLAAHLLAEDCENAEIAAREDAWDLAALGVYGACLARMGETERASEVYERLATFTPTDPEVSLGRGALAQDAGELGAAREFYESALAHSATDAIAARSRAFLATLDY